MVCILSVYYTAARKLSKILPQDSKSPESFNSLPHGDGQQFPFCSLTKTNYLEISSSKYTQQDLHSFLGEGESDTCRYEAVERTN